jgi:SAM-dependent methyltransferase
MICERCRISEASTALRCPGDTVALAVCSLCDAALTHEGVVEIVTRLERQSPCRGQKVIYQPVELPACASWTVLRQDSAARAALMARIIGEVARQPNRRRPRTYLDVGCSTGYFCHAMSRFGLDAQGVDAAADDIRVARLLSSFVRRDGCRYIVADAHDFLSQTSTDPVDVTSALSVIQWCMLNSSMTCGLSALGHLFARTGSLCFLELPYSSEPFYGGMLPLEIDQDWVWRTMRESGCFGDVRRYPAEEHGLIRDLFVGIKE